jgi:hypothetical protein
MTGSPVRREIEHLLGRGLWNTHNVHFDSQGFRLSGVPRMKEDVTAAK